MGEKNIKSNPYIQQMLISGLLPQPNAGFRDNWETDRGVKCVSFKFHGFFFIKSLVPSFLFITFYFHTLSLTQEDQTTNKVTWHRPPEICSWISCNPRPQSGITDVEYLCVSFPPSILGLNLLVLPWLPWKLFAYVHCLFLCNHLQASQFPIDNPNSVKLTLQFIYSLQNRFLDRFPVKILSMVRSLEEDEDVNDTIGDSIRLASLPTTERRCWCSWCLPLLAEEWANFTDFHLTKLKGCEKWNTIFHHLLHQQTTITVALGVLHSQPVYQQQWQ